MASRLEVATMCTAMYFWVRLKTCPVTDALSECPPPEGSRCPPQDTVEDVARACARINAVLPVPCLPIALAAKTSLALRGVDSKLVLGVHRADRMTGHAWLRIDRQEILKGGQNWWEVWAED